MTRSIVLAALSVPFVAGLHAQAGIQLRNNQDQQLDCTNKQVDTLCEMRNQTVSSTGRFDLDGFHNGSVTVRGWNRNDTSVRLKVEVHARSDSRARDLAQQIHTAISSGRVKIDGPLDPLSSGMFDNEWWSVSADVLVPHRTALRLATHNGSIRISDIDAAVEFGSHNGEAVMERVTSHVRGTTYNGSIRLAEVGGNVDFGSHNGSVYLARVAGSVRGNTYNGTVETELAGASFTGRSLEIGTHNGSIRLAIPRSYSARVRADTHNGGIRSDLPESGGRRVSRYDERREFDLHGGGSLMHVMTHSGSIHLRQI